MIERLVECYMRAYCFVAMARRGKVYRGHVAPGVPSNYRVDYRTCKAWRRAGLI